MLGSLCFATQTIPILKGGKLSPQYIPSIMMGSRLLNIDTTKILGSRDVCFRELIFPLAMSKEELQSLFRVKTDSSPP